MPQIFFHGNVIGQGNASPQAAQGLLAKLGTALSSDPHAKEWSGGLVQICRPGLAGFWRSPADLDMRDR